MRLPWTRGLALPELSPLLEKDELITGIAATQDGRNLATTRRGLWVVDAGRAERTGWDRVAKARLDSGVLAVTVVEDVVTWPDGVLVVHDRPEVSYQLLHPAQVTDQVHARVRRSVAASRYLSWPRAGGWVALRRVPGHDGLLTQLRLDAGADPDASGFADAVVQLAAELVGSRPIGVTGVDDGDR